MTRTRTLVVGFTIGVAIAGCSHDDPVAPNRTRALEQPKLAIVDGTNGGNDRFRWLPPFVGSADYDGTLDGGVAQTVEICTPSLGGCPVIATSGVNFSAPSIAGGKKGAGSYFTTTWKTNASLDPNANYRLTVRVGGNVVGYADVDLVATAADLAAVPPGFVGVAVGNSLEINFRLVRGITRTWKGGAAAKGKNADPAAGTAWANDANWAPEGVPYALDTVIVASTPNPPIASANMVVARVEVRDGATLSLGVFNLDVSGSGITAGSGKITSTTGLLRLLGTGTLVGTLPHTMILGTYAVAGNVTVPATFAVATGQLKNPGWLVKVAP